eukprot:1145222-Pelagomonas_calceolata.AAC.11
MAGHGKQMKQHSDGATGVEIASIIKHTSAKALKGKSTHTAIACNRWSNGNPLQDMDTGGKWLTGNCA